MHLMAVICFGHMLMKMLVQPTSLEAAICLGLLLLVRGILSPAHMGGITKGTPRSDALATESSDHEEEENRVAPEQPQGASATDEELEDQGGEEDSGGPATNDGNEDFHVDADLLL